MGRWRVERAGRAEEFSAQAGPLLSRYPVEANVLLTVLDGAVGGRDPDDNCWLLVRDPDGEVAGAAMRSGGYPAFLPPNPAEAITPLAQWLHANEPALVGVTGPLPEATAFAVEWERLTGLRARTAMAERMHVLTALRPATGVSGQGGPATPDQVDLVLRWMRAFAAEAGALHDEQQLQHLVPRRVAEGRLWLWRDGGRPVALAGVHPAVHGVARVGPVYTPPEHRSRGFGSAVTAAVTAQALADGADRAMLYTDLANPVSNAIYARLGYRPVCDAAILAFER